ARRPRRRDYREGRALQPRGVRARRGEHIRDGARSTGDVMGNVLRAGLVGCGSVSQRRILPHLSLPDAREKVRLVAVAHAVEERARQSAERFDVPAHFTRVEDMLAGADIDLVLVATPIPYHFANAMAAIVAGKHVYVQKTMTTTLAEADELLAARDRAGVKLAAAVGYELCSTTRELRGVVCE